MQDINTRKNYGNQKDFDYQSPFETYLQVVNQAICALCKVNQFTESALVCERADELRRQLPLKFTKAKNGLDTANSGLLAMEAVHVKRRIKLLTLQVLASYGVFVVKNDQYSVDLEEINK